MKITDMLKNMLRDFFVVTTGTLIATATFLLVFYGEDETMTIHYASSLMWQVLAFGAMSVIPNLIFFSKRELSKKAVIIRKIIHLTVLTTLLLTTAVMWEWVEADSPVQFLLFLGFFVVIYLTVMVVEYKRDKKTAEALNKKLKEYRHEK